MKFFISEWISGAEVNLVELLKILIKGLVYIVAIIKCGFLGLAIILFFEMIKKAIDEN